MNLVGKYSTMACLLPKLTSCWQASVVKHYSLQAYMNENMHERKSLQHFYKNRTMGKKGQ